MEANGTIGAMGKGLEGKSEWLWLFTGRSKSELPLDDTKEGEVVPILISND